jgi:S-adenosylmethionine synthetase
VTTFGTGVVPDERIAQVVSELFDFRPAALIETLDLLRPIYKKTSAYGHFGRTEKTFTWESTDRAAELADALAPKGAGVNGKAAKQAKAGKASKPSKRSEQIARGA